MSEISATAKTNDKPGPCTACGATVAPGAGSLWWEAGPDDGGDVAGRTPTGWRVTHLDSAACAAAKVARAERELARERTAAEARKQARATFESACDALRTEVEKLVAEHGLAPRPCRMVPFGSQGALVREEICVAPANIAGAAHETLFSQTIYPEGGGHSTGWFGSVVRHEKGIVAMFGPNEGTAESWAPQALIEEGVRRYRVGQWWTEGAYSIDSYPGPGVVESDLTEEERAEVDVLRARKTEAHTARRRDATRRMVEAAPPLVRLVKTRGASLVTTIDEQAFARYLRAMEAASLAEREAGHLTVTVEVTFPEGDYTKGGKLRAAAAKWVPDRIKILAHVTAVVVVTPPRT